jgi:hypothetical protein
MENRFIGATGIKLGKYAAGLVLRGVRDKNIWHSLCIFI